jgi:hypothetical protein
VLLYKSFISIQINRQTAGVRKVYILHEDIPICCKFHKGSVLCATCIHYYFLVVENDNLAFLSSFLLLLIFNLFACKKDPCEATERNLIDITL